MLVELCLRMWQLIDLSDYSLTVQPTISDLSGMKLNKEEQVGTT